MTPEISIIVPAYNEEKNIARCLDSILNQTFTDFEVLCVDDGSTDKTFDIIKEYSEKDSRIILFKNTLKGVSSARNLALDNAKGKYIGFVDSDDFIQPQTYEFLHRSVTENKSDMSICFYQEISEYQKFQYSYSSVNCDCQYFFENNLGHRPIICLWLKLVKREIIEENKLRFENLRLGEDMVFCSFLWTKCKNVQFINSPLYCRNIHFSSTSHREKEDLIWFDHSKAFLKTYDNFLNYKDKNISIRYFEDGIKTLLSFRLFTRKVKNKENKENIKKLFKEYFPKYRKCKDISLANKVYVFISYHFPLLYEVRRKLLDKTIR